MSEIALLGKKIGMTREFYKSGQLVSVTVLKMEKARVIQVIDKEKRGYTAVQLGYGKIKSSKLTKAMKGYFSKRNTEAKRKLKEYRVQNIENYKEGTDQKCWTNPSNSASSFVEIKATSLTFDNKIS